MINSTKPKLLFSLFVILFLNGCIREPIHFENFFCLPNQQALYNAWGISTPSLPCPYNESDRRNARLIFTDGTAVDILPGVYGNGGVFLQDLNCNQTSSNGLLSYILIRWSINPKNGSSVSTYPVFNCNNNQGTIIKLKDAAGKTYFLYTTTRQFSYNNGSAWVTKEIDSIEFI